MNEEQAKQKANWCLNCANPICSNKGCPIHTQIPQFIDNIKQDNLIESYKILRENNFLSHVCGLICPQEEQCEGSCIRGIKQNPTEIGKLEVYVNEWAKENNIKYDPKETIVGNNEDKSIAIVGSGPAGMECAYRLLLKKYKVDIYEKDSMPGGILEYGIPDFRLDKALVKEAFETLKELGANFIFNTELGKDITLEQLQKDYDAVVIAVGASKPQMYKVCEEDLDSIYDPDTFLRMYHSKEHKDLGKVVVIGGGNVAMDCSRVALRIGAAESKILYRRDEEHMPALKIELEDAKADGVKWFEKVRVVSANVENGKLVSLNCIHTEIVDGKAQDVPNSEFIEPCDTLVFAIGLKPNKDLLVNQGVELDDWNMIKVDEHNKTNLANVYTAGDTIESQATVCRAIAGGKKVAAEIDKFLINN